jgi:hypothetical protein
MSAIGIKADPIYLETGSNPGDPGTQFSREVHVAFLSPGARKVSGRGSFGFRVQFWRHFKGRVQIWHLAVRIQPPQPTLLVEL